MDRETAEKVAEFLNDDLQMLEMSNDSPTISQDSEDWRTNRSFTLTPRIESVEKSQLESK